MLQAVKAARLFNIQDHSSTDVGKVEKELFLAFRHCILAHMLVVEGYTFAPNFFQLGVLRVDLLKLCLNT